MKNSTKLMLFCIIHCLLLLILFQGKLDATSSLELGLRILKSDPINLSYNHIIPGAKQTLFIIGENHANVETQIQLAALLTDLCKAKATDTILIEGSNGPVEVESFNRQITQASCKSANDIREFWNQQLHLGKISGFEFVALTYPGLKIFGVEDLKEKIIYQITSNYSKDNFDLEIASNRRGLEQIEQALISLKTKASMKELAEIKPELDELKSEIFHLEEMTENVNSQFIPILKEIPQLAELENKMLPIYEKIGEKDLLNAQKWQARIIEINSQLQNRHDINLAKEKEQLEIKLNNFVSQNRTELENLEPLLTQHKQKEDEIKPFSEKIKQSSKEFEEYRTKVEDHFFIIFNSIITLGDYYGLDVSKIKTFFIDEADKIEKESISKSRRDELIPRDRAMVKNSIDYLKRTGKNSAVLIVGYAHLEGIADQLKSYSINFIGGKLKACDNDTEPWELAGWEERQKEQFNIFSSEDKLKEKTLLQNDSWKKDRIEMHKFFLNYRQKKIIPPSGQSTKSIFITSSPIDRNAQPGEHIIERGIVPFSNKSFLIVNYDILKSESTKYSDGQTVFAYYRRKKDPNGNYVQKIITPWEELSVTGFTITPPQTKENENPKQVVIILNGLGELEPFLQYFRLDNGTGINPHKWTSIWSASIERPSIYLCIDAKRANENIKKLDIQDPANFGNTIFFEEKDLYELNWTPSRGDNGQMIFIIARNTEEFRNELKYAAENKKFVNKQVGLITCGDLLIETAEVREAILGSGALMVWNLYQQIKPQAAQRFKEEINNYLSKIKPQERPKTIDGLIYEVLKNWKKKEPNSPDLKYFELSFTYVLNFQELHKLLYRNLG